MNPAETVSIRADRHQTYARDVASLAHYRADHSADRAANHLAGAALARREQGVDAHAEDAYWLHSYRDEPYYEAGRYYEDYRPAYEMGWTARAHGAAHFDLVEPELAAAWDAKRGVSSLEWAQARHASLAAWRRADRLYGDATGAGMAH